MTGSESEPTTPRLDRLLALAALSTFVAVLALGVATALDVESLVDAHVTALLVLGSAFAAVAVARAAVVARRRVTDETPIPNLDPRTAAVTAVPVAAVTAMAAGTVFPELLGVGALLFLVASVLFGRATWGRIRAS